MSHIIENSHFLFLSFRGERQCENLSPVLTTLFQTDIKSFQCEFQYGDITLSSLKLACVGLCRRYSCFLTDEKDFQKCLGAFCEFAELSIALNKSINFDKTEI